MALWILLALFVCLFDCLGFVCFYVCMFVVVTNRGWRVIFNQSGDTWAYQRFSKACLLVAVVSSRIVSSRLVSSTLQRTVSG